MLNKTAEKKQKQTKHPFHNQEPWISPPDNDEHVTMWFVLRHTHLSFSLLTRPRCSSVMCSDGGLKWDMTTRNSSKPIASTVPSPFWWKFLKKKRKQKQSRAEQILTFYPTSCLSLCGVKQLRRLSNCTFCRRRPLWSASGWGCTPDQGFHWSDLSWGLTKKIFKEWHMLSHDM